MSTLPRNSLIRSHVASVDPRLVAFIRLFLSSFALFMIAIDPTEPDRLVNLTYGSLVLYTLFSLTLYLLVIYEQVFFLRIEASLYWLDTIWYLLLISLSNGTNSIFFFFLFFAIANAAFSGDRSAGISIATVSSVGLIVIGYATTPVVIGDDLARFFLRPLSLFVIGYLLTEWGSYSTRSLLRLKLLRDIGTLSNPRFGATRTLCTDLDLLREHYSADGFIYLSRDASGELIEVVRSQRPDDRESDRLLLPNSGFIARLLSPGDNISAVYENRLSGKFAGRRRLHVFDVKLDKFIHADSGPYDELSETLETRSFITSPVLYRGESIGRVYLYADSGGRFERGDVHFLRQVLEQIVPVIENIRLLDRLASDAAEEERRRIGRDIHDSIIQPYVGLQMGIDSFSELLRISRDQNELAPEIIDQLFERANRLKVSADASIEDLRHFVSGLGSATGEKMPLAHSLRRFAAKFSDATSIKVSVTVDEGCSIGDRLAAELFQITTEGLSNIRRHTDAQNAEILLRTTPHTAVIEISNEVSAKLNDEFIPNSIRERTSSLGGDVRIEHDEKMTKVVVEIPL